MLILEIFLVVIAIILLLIVVILIIPVGIIISYYGDFNELTLKIRIWLFNIKLNLSSKKVKKTEKVAEKKIEKEIPKTEEDVKKLKFDFKKYLPLVKLAPPTIYRLIETIVFDQIYILWFVKAKDAAEAAISSGRYYAIYYSLYAAITPPFNIKMREVIFKPDFIGDGSVNNVIKVRVSTRIISVIIVALWFLLNASKTNAIKPKKR